MKIKINILIVFLIVSIFASARTVKFGGTVGFKYDPDTFTIATGDFVTWEGDFASHPLVSTMVPAGANTINVSTGVSFTYTVQIAGIYRFKCDFHGFKGVFLAIDSTLGGINPVSIIKSSVRLNRNANILAVNDLKGIGVNIELMDLHGAILFHQFVSNMDKVDFAIPSLSIGYYLIRITDPYKKSEAVLVYSEN